GPYGTHVVKELLENYNPDGNLILNEASLAEQRAEASNYVFIGGQQFLDSAGIEYLADFVYTGNTALISARTLPDELVEYFYFYDCDDYEWSGFLDLEEKEIQSNIWHPDLQLDTGVSARFIYYRDTVEADWQFFDRAYFCGEEDGFVPLGAFNEDFINFARIPYGDGFFYLHSTPVLFSNLSLLNRENLDYASAIFSHLQPGDIIWDEHSKVLSFPRAGRNRLSGRTPLSYILKQPALAWAWYLLLGTAILFLLFRTKRRQRIIPVLESDHNTSMEFLQTIGNLYFLQKDHKKIALHKMRLFLAFVRERYQLQTNQLDDAFIEQLLAKSQVTEKEARDIFLIHKNITTSSFVSENTLIKFNLLIEHFYKTAK
ncbi:MAG: hypothetical protein AAF242_19835, partial [Bacteroidota bacterium]